MIWPIMCCRRQFQILLLFKVWYFKRIVYQTILMKCHTLFFRHLGKMSQNLSSAAVVIGALRVKNPKIRIHINSLSRAFYGHGQSDSEITLKFYLLVVQWIIPNLPFDKWASMQENLSLGGLRTRQVQTSLGIHGSDQRLCYSRSGKYHI